MTSGSFQHEASDQTSQEMKGEAKRYSKCFVLDVMLVVSSAYVEYLIQVFPRLVIVTLTSMLSVLCLVVIIYNSFSAF